MSSIRKVLVTKVSQEDVEWEGILTKVNINVEREIWTIITLDIKEAVRNEARVGGSGGSGIEWSC